MQNTAQALVILTYVRMYVCVGPVNVVMWKWLVYYETSLTLADVINQIETFL